MTLFEKSTSMQIIPFPAHYQLGYHNFDFSSFSRISCHCKYLLSHKDSREVKDVFKVLRPTIIGLIAAAALLLMTKDNFGSPSANPSLFALSLGIFAAAFFFTRFKKTNPILVMFVCGLIGLLFY